MAYSATAAKGTTFTWNAVLVPGVTNITFGGTKNMLDVTALADTSKVYKGDRPQYGECSFDLQWDPAQASHVSLYGDVGGVSKAALITMANTDASTIGFSGWVKSWQWTVPNGGAVTVKVSIKITTDVSVTV
jgi:hypothetical protein